MGEMKEGLVIKGIGGFYYVQCGDVLHACRARGKFRKDKISPYAGDRVRIEVDANDEGYVQEILPRKNFLVRPPLANLDKLFVVSSVCDPQPSTLIIDKTIAAAELKGIEPVLVFTKTDLSDTTELKDIYGSIGIRCYFVSAADGVGVLQNHPYQYAYYNFLAPADAEETMELDYWDVSTVNALRLLLGSERNEALPLTVSGTDALSHLGLEQALSALTAEENALLTVTEQPEDASYLLMNTTYGRIYGATVPRNWRVLLEIRSYGHTICTVYERMEKGTWRD